MVLPMIAAMGKLSTTGSDLVRASKGLTDVFDKYQKATLSVGVDYQVASAALTGSMTDLKGSLDDRFVPAFLTLKAGLGTNSAGVSKLISEQKLTNIAFQNTASALREVQISTGMSVKALNQLASTTTKTANKYFMSSDALVKAIGDLKEVMPVVMLSGNTKMVEGLQGWIASLGPGMEKTATRIANEFLSPEYDKMGILSQLNIEHLREQIPFQKGARETTAFMNKVIKTAASTLESFGTIGEQNFRQIQSMTKVYGTLGVDFAIAAKQLGKAASRREDSLAEAGKDFGTAISTLKRPFEELFMNKLMPSLLELTQGDSFNIDHLVKKVENLALVVGSLLDPKQWENATEFLSTKFRIWGTEFKYALFEGTPFFGDSAEEFAEKMTTLHNRLEDSFEEMHNSNQDRLAELSKQTGILNNIDEGVNNSDIDVDGAGYLNMSQSLITDQIMNVLDPTGGGDPNAEMVFQLKILQEILLKDKEGESTVAKFGD